MSHSLDCVTENVVMLRWVRLFVVIIFLNSFELGPKQLNERVRLVVRSSSLELSRAVRAMYTMLVTLVS